MEKYFTIDMLALRFARNTLVFSLLGLIPVLLTYVALTPGFSTVLLDGGAPLSRFLRQVVTNGLPVVFLLNYVSFFLFAWIVATPGRSYKFSFIVLADLPVRVLSFVGLHALIYVLSADWFGSFGGSRATALRVVAPTLVRSFLFENISGVYLYATLVSALPLYVTAVESSEKLGKLAKALPGRSGPVLFALGLFGFSVLAMTAFAALLLWRAERLTSF